MRTPQRLLVRGVNWLGDAVMSIPALLRLRTALPETEISILTADKLVELWRDQPFVDEVIPFSRTQGVGQVSARLRSGQFDTALIFPNSFRSAFESWLAGIPIRVGYNRKLLLTHSIPRRKEHIEMRKRSVAEVRTLLRRNPTGPRQNFPSAGHHLHQYLRLVSIFGAKEEPLQPLIHIGPEEALTFRTRFGLHPTRLKIGLNAGAEYGSAKRWPAENFAAVARTISEQREVEWLIFGGSGDADIARQIESALGPGLLSVNLAGRTSLRELMVGLSLCAAVVTNDTGPMHLAAAVGSTVIVPFGSTSPELTGPGRPGDSRHHLITGQAPCAPCFLRVCPVDFRCMRSIAPNNIARHVLTTLDRNDTRAEA